VTIGLAQALGALLAGELPGLFGGGAPPVRVAVTSVGFTAADGPADAEAGRPRPDDHVDELAFDAADPAGPYTLTRSPQPGPRRVRLLTTAGDRIALTPAEVGLDPADPRSLTLAPRPGRDLTAVTAIQVQYQVVAVFGALGLREELALVLDAADPTELDRAQALTLAVLTLHRERLLVAATETLRSDAYAARLDVTGLTVGQGTAGAGGSRRVALFADVVLKASRALAADEGTPIVRIGSGEGPPDPARPVDIRIDVEA
jgi:hypothetical protein